MKTKKQFKNTLYDLGVAGNDIFSFLTYELRNEIFYLLGDIEIPPATFSHDWEIKDIVKESLENSFL